MSAQLSLLAYAEQTRPHKRVRQTSREAYAIGRESFTGRKADVLRWLAHWWNEKQYSPTSAELTEWKRWEWEALSWTWDKALLYVRRGLSDLQSVGIVEPVSPRPCRVSRSSQLVHAWRVREVGSLPPSAS